MACHLGRNTAKQDETPPAHMTNGMSGPHANPCGYVLPLLCVCVSFKWFSFTSSNSTKLHFQLAVRTTIGNYKLQRGSEKLALWVPLTGGNIYVFPKDLCIEKMHNKKTGYTYQIIKTKCTTIKSL